MKMVDEKKLIEALKEEKNSIYSDIFSNNEDKERLLQSIIDLIDIQPKIENTTNEVQMDKMKNLKKVA